MRDHPDKVSDIIATIDDIEYEPDGRQRLWGLQARHDLTERARTILRSAEKQRRALTAAERAEADAIEDTLGKIGKILIRHEERLEAERTMPTDGYAAFPSLAPRPALTRPTGARYRAMFPNGGGTAGFHSLDEYLTVVHGGLYDGRLKALTSSTGAGFLIPEQFAAEILDRALENEIVRPRARIEPMTSDSKRIGGLTHGDGTAGPFGGLGGWAAEGASIAVTDPKVRSLTLAAKKLAVLTNVSNEALADGASLTAQLGAALPRSLGWRLDSAFLVGTGAGQPLGILNAPCTVEVAKETGQGASTILYENLCKMFARLLPGSVNNAVWVASTTAIPQLLALTIPVGTGGAPVPVISESNGEFRLLTRPVLFTEKLPVLGQRGDILLADLSYYVVGLRSDVTLEASRDAGFATDTTYFRSTLRADGLPLLEAAYKPAHGDTLSPFVVLGART